MSWFRSARTIPGHWRARSSAAGNTEGPRPILRKAFAGTMIDAEFLADAKKSNLDISPLSGDDVAKTVDNLFKIEPAVAAKLKQILLPK